jgi:hypothetical protein
MHPNACRFPVTKRPWVDLTLDTGALVALERNRRDMGKVVEAAVQAGARITVPANADAAWRPSLRSGSPAAPAYEGPLNSGRR